MNKILVFLEAEEGNIKRSSLEVATAAVKLANEKGLEVGGVVFNGNEATAKQAGEYGVKTVVSAKSDALENYSSTAAAKAIQEIVDTEGYDTVMFSANARGLELAPRVSAKIEAGYISDAIELSAEDDGLHAKKPVYAGKAIITTKIDTQKQVVSLRPNVFTAEKADGGDAEFKEIAVDIPAEETKVKVTEVQKNKGKMDVLEADIVVSGGRGIKGPENYHLIEELAEAFGGAHGASRAVVDAGWRPHSEQVGQTGKTVSPSLYVACGISGAVQHLAGMSSSKYIVAINKDKDAPIFGVCDYGLVGDLFEIVPKLKDKVKEVTES